MRRAEHLVQVVTHLAADESGDSLMEYALLSCLVIAVCTLIVLALNKGG